MNSMHLYLKNLVLCYFTLSIVSGQSNFKLSNPACLDLLKGNFPQDSFMPKQPKSLHDIADNVSMTISDKSLAEILIKLISFENRNTISDNANSSNRGIGAARRWVKSSVENYSVQAENRLIPCELEFDQSMCSVLTHRELFAILPGTGPRRSELVIVEAHLDTRCEDVCDTICIAEGADDNTSGASLVTELAKTMSPFHFDRTIVFIWITGEEQSLGGSRAFAKFCKANNLKLKAVFNNDIVGGIECGKTSSPPGCPGPGLVDSMRMRIFSAGTNNSMQKNLARLTKIITPRLFPSTPIPQMDIMAGEDRSGRGSDHIPFREEGYNSIRYCSSYEHGDGNPTQKEYTDRQHSSRDILGKDIDGDGKLDSLYVNFNYLKRNTLVNAASIINAADGPDNDAGISFVGGGTSVPYTITHTTNSNIDHYLIGLRILTSYGFDTIIETKELSGVVIMPRSGIFYGSVAVVDQQGLISMFSNEVQFRQITATTDVSPLKAIELLQNYPNPYDESTTIPILVNDLSKIKSCRIEIANEQGVIVKRENVNLVQGINEIFYDYSWHNYVAGIYYYSLFVNDNKLDTKSMVYRN